MHWFVAFWRYKHRVKTWFILHEDQARAYDITVIIWAISGKRASRNCKLKFTRRMCLDPTSSVSFKKTGVGFFQGNAFFVNAKHVIRKGPFAAICFEWTISRRIWLCCDFPFFKKDIYNVSEDQNKSTVRLCSKLARGRSRVPVRLSLLSSRLAALFPITDTGFILVGQQSKSEKNYSVMDRWIFWRSSSPLMEGLRIWNRLFVCLCFCCCFGQSTPFSQKCLEFVEPWLTVTHEINTK